MWHTLKKVDRWLDKHLILAIFLLFLVLLRIPGFFEPYWYGDEAIYLTIGNALRDGQILYRDIVDHKTPLIYLLATVPGQLWFRFILLVWMGLATTVVYFSLRSIRSVSSHALVLSLAFFVGLTSLPWFEGHIPNGELFVIGFVAIGLFIVSRTPLWERLVHGEVNGDSHENAGRAFPFYFLSGFFFGLGILTKVPAVFDTLAVGLMWWWVLLREVRIDTLSLPTIVRKIWPLLKSAIVFCSGVALPIGASVLVFLYLGAGKEFLQFGLLYNFHYSGSWVVPFENPILLWATSLVGKAILTSILLIVLSAYVLLNSTKGRGVLGPWLIVWCALSLFASTLSQRPYPHYFLQFVLPFVYLVGWGFSGSQTRTNQGNWLERVRDFFESHSTARVLSVFLVGGFFLSVLRLLSVQTYPVVPYYTSFVSLMRGDKRLQEYQDSFNHLVPQNREVAKIVTQEDGDLYIWGTNPLLYAVTGTYPKTRFIVAFHVKDFSAFSETMDYLETSMPEYIVRMNEDADSLPGLSTLLDTHYFLRYTSVDLELWQKRPSYLYGDI